MLKIHITIDNDTFEFEHDTTPFSDILSSLQSWFEAIGADVKTQAQIDKLTARINKASERLKQNVTENTPT